MAKRTVPTHTATLGEAQIIRNWRAAKRDLADAQARKDRWEAEIREFLGDNKKAVDAKGNTLVGIVDHPGQKRANLEILGHLFPDAYDATVKASPYTYLK